MSGETRPNEEQVQYWNESAGPRWVAAQDKSDAQLRVFGLRAMEAAALRPGERVVDVGAGCGDTTIELARRVGPQGHVHAADVSAVMLERTRERTKDLANVSTQVADVQAAALEGAPFDLAFSRFGVMFFDDPAAAFRNLRRAIRPGGRLACCTWRSREENPWLTQPTRAAAQFVEIKVPQDPHAPGPFGLFDRERTLRLLGEAGWKDVAIDPFDAPMRMGNASTAQEAAEFLVTLGPVGAALAGADAALRERVLTAIREVFVPYEGPEGVVMTGATWIVTGKA